MISDYSDAGTNTWTNNTAWGGAVGLDPVPEGIIIENPQLVRDKNGVMQPSNITGYPLLRAEVGPSWWERTPDVPLFPSPGLGENDVELIPTLSWRSAESSDSRDIYFGTDPDNLILQGNQTTTQFISDELLPLTTYYWRIDEFNSTGKTLGPIWYFTTEGNGQSIKNFYSTDDTYGRASEPNTNFGSQSFVRINGGFLKFNVSEISGPIISAKLKLLGAKSAAYTSLHFVADTTWSEMTLTYDTQPDIEDVIDTTYIENGSWCEFDCSDYVTNNKQYSFYTDMISNEGTGAPTFASKESGTGAVLEIIFEDSLTSIKKNNWEIVEYKLSVSNYPNPFNPNTTIYYSIPDEGELTITIYDILGRNVQTLLSEKKTAGTYNVQWNGKDISGNMVSSGIYFCKVDYTNTKERKTIVHKMIMVQ